MANTFLTAENIAAVAVKMAGMDLGLGRLVHRDLASEFRPGRGKTVSIRVPGAVAAQTRDAYDKSTPITMDEVAEQSIDVTLTDHVYSAVALSEGDMTLEIEDFSAQVLRPQVSAVVKRIEARVASAMASTPETTSIPWDAAAPAKTFTAIRAQLRNNGVSAEDRITAVVGTSVYGALLDGPDGTFDKDGKVRGIEVIENSRLGSDQIVAFIKEAFALVVRAPEVPEGVSFGTSMSDNDFALRFMRDYDASVAADRSMVGTFVAATALPLVLDNEDGTVTLVPHGGAIRVDTSTAAV